MQMILYYLVTLKKDYKKRLDKVYQWSLKWKIKFSAKKSNILHVRQSLITRTNFNFKLGNMVLPIVTQYKYLGINGDMGWTSSCVRYKTNIIRFWNRLMCMNNNCLPKIIFNWDYSYRGNT